MKSKEINLNPAGPAFEELTLEEMVASQGSGDVKAQTTAICLSAAESSAACAEALSAAVSAVASFASKKC
ncbi:lichenicidin A2 family type 2 lantibiotic [Clostridium beijerinckii]|uniref:lichenicidin A2 family type 2 lantibiotic n=1 Tax=Clostridium beijerinckii TaxID=1520 RepID=UPI00156F701F|nr:mersacidin family lantibiotic [Clostridium beijerinckii]NRT74868.1 type 2 lantibiotic (TIGR03893 family) [Clostridium beijerinckii]